MYSSLGLVGAVKQVIKEPIADPGLSVEKTKVVFVAGPFQV
jgi:hypothetical protein